MKVVLRHQATGRYYSAPGKWVRRADNALAFENAVAACDFVRSHQIPETQAVYRLAPYLIPLLHARQCERVASLREGWTAARISQWYCDQTKKFLLN